MLSKMSKSLLTAFLVYVGLSCLLQYSKNVNKNKFYNDYRRVGMAKKRDENIGKIIRIRK